MKIFMEKCLNIDEISLWNFVMSLKIKIFSIIIKEISVKFINEKFIIVCIC